MPERQCLDCGFLGIRNYHTNEVDEANGDYRTRGHFNAEIHKGQPRCSKNLRDLPALARALPNSSDETCPPAIKAAIEPKHDCARWTEYHPNHSPKDHDQMIWQQAAFDVQARIADVQVRMADFQAKAIELQATTVALRGETLEWKKLQAVENEKLTKQIAALGQVHQNQSIDVAKSGAKGANWQALWAFAAFVVAALALAVSIWKR